MKTFKIADMEISSIIFGTTYLGNYNDYDKAFSHLDEYYNYGGRCIDTARIYSNFAPEDICPSETVIGEWLKAKKNRDEIVIVTKGAHPPFGAMDKSRLSYDDIAFDLDESLKALQIDYTDVYFLHRDDGSIPVEQIMTSLNKLVLSGKIKAIGASNWSGRRIAMANEYALNNGLTPFSTSQIQWCLAKASSKDLNDDTLICMDESEFKFYKSSQIPVMAFNAQAKGLFTKLVEFDGDITKLPEKVVDRYLNSDNIEANLAYYEKVIDLSSKHNVTPTVINLAYITSNEITAGAIIGCSNINQIKDSMAASNFTLTKEEIAYLK